MNNEKKSSKRKILNILLLLLGVSTGYFIYNILLLDGIENILRYLFIALLSLVFIIYVLASLTIKIRTKLKKFFYYFFLVALIIGQTSIGYYINKFYGTLDNMSKNTVLYSTSLVTLKTNEITEIKDVTKVEIGMINNTSSIDGYTISKEIISDNNLTTTNKITEYEDYFSMLNDLYAEKIDAIFLPKDYVAMFESTEDFAQIGLETKVIISKDKEVKKKATVTNKKLTEPFTVLVMGIDSIASDIKNANSNGDSLMLISFNPNTLNATILSIPRDTYVPISCFPNNKKNKITHAGWHGEKCMEETIENFTGVDIDYYVKVDFKGVVDLVEILGGITVDVPMNFCEQDSARSFKNQQCLKKGLQVLNGEEALALARHRHTLLTGDFQRGLNQQLVVEGILGQLKTVKDVNQFYNILTTIEKHMDTNLTTSQILSLYNVGKDIITSGASKSNSVIAMQQLYLQEASMLIYDASFGKPLSSAVYYPKSLAAVVKAMKVNLGLEKATLIKEFSFSINETYEKNIIGKDLLGALNISLVPDFTGDSKSIVESWAAARNVTVVIKEIDKDNSYTQGDVVSQSVPAKTDVTTINSITITIANIVEKEEEEPAETMAYYCTLQEAIEISKAKYDTLNETAIDGTPCNDQTDFTEITS